ncbi:MAG: XRE family transcriptional regulator [Oscillospiraceae bacterium]|nr:XRE family transcriptional regulator [Oscillospiraceae bacterium]
MTEQLKEIGRRLFALRCICELTTAEMAEKLGISEDEYVRFENGDQDFSFSFMYNCAEIFGVDVYDIMSGDSGKLTTCSIVKKGRGFDVKRLEAYNYKHLAHTFKDRKAEPFLVTVEPGDKTQEFHAHEGQEFNYMLSGKMKFFVGSISYELEEGDSIYFDSGIPHAIQVMEETAQFIAVVMK